MTRLPAWQYASIVTIALASGCDGPAPAPPAATSKEASPQRAEPEPSRPPAEPDVENGGLSEANKRNLLSIDAPGPAYRDQAESGGRTE